MADLEDLPLRPDLVGQKPYGAPQLSVPVSLNVNENTHRIPENVAIDIIERLSRAILTINRYPDREFVGLRQSLASYLGHGLRPENIWAANGSNEVLQQIFQAFGGPGRTALSFVPTYSMYPLIAQGTGTDWIAVPRDENFELNSRLVTDSIRTHKPDIILICSPNNPTGTPVDPSVIEAAYAAMNGNGNGVLVVDEAYAEFANQPGASALDLLVGRPRLMISRTMSKAFAFAGARLGYLAADSAVVDALRLVRLPYHLSALTQAAAEGALAHSTEMLATVADIKYQRDRILEGLKALGLKVYRSDANFVLFGGLAEPESVWQQLLDQGILIRNVGLPGTLRVTAGTEAETTAFLAALERILVDN